MRRRKSDLHARVNRNLPLEFDDVRLTSYAGLELLERYLRTRRFNQLVREAFADLPRGGDFGVVVMVRVFVGLVIVGGRRLRHLASVADDPIFQRFGNVRVVPTARTLSRWLRHFTMRTVTRFQALNAAVVRQLLPTLGLRTWTVDVDGVVVSTGLQVERAARGYNPHQRKVPSYDPIMAHLAETTHILRVKNRSGNVHDGKAGLPFLRALWPQLVGLRTGGARLRFRMDGAFFRQDVLRWLQGRGVGYAINVPFYRWLDLQRYIRDSPTWVPVAPGVTGFAVPGAETPWHIPVTVTIYRKKVHHRATKNYQLDLFDPNDGHYEYSAVTSNLALTVRNYVVLRLWAGQPREDHRAAQDRAGLPQRPDPDLRRQQCVAAARGARSQPVDELPTRDGRPAAAPHPEAHRRAPAAERADAPLRTVSSGRPAGPPRWQDAVADDRQSPDASDVHPHCQRPRERLSF